MSEDKPGLESGDRDEQIAEILGRCSDAMNGGDELDIESLIVDHPDLAPDLERALSTLALVSPDEPSTTPALPSLGDYEIRREIGRGGMGVVYEGFQKSVDRRIALKMLPWSLSRDPSLVRRFRREARVAGLLRHPNIVSVFDFGVERETPYFVMEFVEGESLDRVLARLRRKPRLEMPTAFEETDSGSRDLLSNSTSIDLPYCLRVAEAFAGVADGVQHAHEQGVVHRDLKPSNLLLDPSGRLHVLDFGLARLEGQENLTRSGQTLGTPRYMSPEQIRGGDPGEVDHRTDVYGLGASLYEMVTWSPPFDGENEREILQKILHDSPVPPRRLQARIPRDLEVILFKCLEKDPRHRYATSGDLARDLRRCLRGDAIEARPPRWTARWARAVRRHAVRSAVLGTLFGLLVAVGFLAYRNHEVEETRDQEEYEREVRKAVGTMHVARLSLSFDDVDGMAVDTHAMFNAEDLMGMIAGSRRSLSASAELLERCAQLLPTRPEASYHRAHALDLLGKSEQAIEELDLLLARFPNFIPGYDLRGRIRADRGEMERASQDRLRASSQAVGEWSKVWLQAHSAFERRSWQEAGHGFDRLLRMEQEGETGPVGFGIDSRLYRGVARLESGDYHGAAEDLIVARAELAPSDDAAPISLALGRAYYHAGNPTRAEELFHELYDRSEHPDEVVFWITSLYHRWGENEKGLRWTEKIPDLGDRSRNRAMFLVELERFGDAVQEASRSIESDPEHALGYVVRGYAYFRWYSERSVPSDLESCCSDMKKGLELDPENAYVRTGYGTSLVAQGRYVEGITMLRSAVARSARVDYAHFVLAQAYRRMGKVPEAVDCFEQAIAVNPRYTPAYCELGEIKASLGEWERARDLFERALAIRPIEIDAERGLACLLVEHYDIEEAVSRFRRAYTKPLELIEACTRIARAHRIWGRVDAAVEVHLHALILLPLGSRELFQEFYRLLNDRATSLSVRRKCDVIWALRGTLARENLDPEVETLARVTLDLATG